MYKNQFRKDQVKSTEKVSFLMNLKFFAIILLFSVSFVFVYGESEPDIDFMLYKANQYFKLYMHDEAISLYDQVLNEEPDNVEALMNKGNILSYVGKNNEAISYYEKVLKLAPQNQLALFKLQEALLDTTSYKYGFLDGVLEITVHDSNDGLVAYHRTTKILALNHELVVNMVENWPVKKIITLNNQKFSVHQKMFEQVEEKNTIYGFHEIPFSEEVDFTLASAWHYQIPIEKGDVVRYTYSIFRPAD